MTAFNPGTGGTLKSTTLEDAFLEAFQKLNAAESVLDINPATTSISLDTDAGIATMSASIPVQTSIGDNGEILATAYTVGYVTDAYATGNPVSDLSASTLAGAVIELCQLLQATENTQSADDNVQYTINGNTGRFVISAALPITLGIGTTGKIEISATEYLA